MLAIIKLNPFDKNIGKELFSNFPTTVVPPTIINDKINSK